MPHFIVRRLLKHDGNVEVLGDPMSMAQIRTLLGANSLDVVVLQNGMVMIVDDDGIERNLPVNPMATEMYLRRCVPGATVKIYGDVVIVPDADFDPVQ